MNDPRLPSVSQRTATVRIAVPAVEAVPAGAVPQDHIGGRHSGTVRRHGCILPSCRPQAAASRDLSRSPSLIVQVDDAETAIALIPKAAGAALPPGCDSF